MNLFEGIGKIIEGTGEIIKGTGELIKNTSKYLDDIPFKKIHEGTESKEECEKLYRDLSGWAKKMEFKETGLFRNGPKCVLYVSDKENTNQDN